MRVLNFLYVFIVFIYISCKDNNISPDESTSSSSSSSSSSGAPPAPTGVSPGESIPLTVNGSFDTIYAINSSSNEFWYRVPISSNTVYSFEVIPSSDDTNDLIIYAAEIYNATSYGAPSNVIDLEMWIFSNQPSGQYTNPLSYMNSYGNESGYITSNQDKSATTWPNSPAIADDVNPAIFAWSNSFDTTLYIMICPLTKSSIYIGSYRIKATSP